MASSSFRYNEFAFPLYPSDVEVSRTNLLSLSHCSSILFNVSWLRGIVPFY